MTDPLEYFIRCEPFKKENIKSYHIGGKYCILELSNGNYGVCGIVARHSTAFIPDIIDLNDFSQRQLYTCYLNAIYNPTQIKKPVSSFVENIKANTYHTIVMIGMFRPLLKRYKELGISPIVFDFNKDEPDITPIEQQPYWLKQADLVILSGTTLANNTFTNILNNIDSSCQVAMAGPSTLMHPYLFELHKKMVLSGMLFKPNNQELIQCICDGKDTQYFKKYGRKIDVRPA